MLPLFSLSCFQILDAPDEIADKLVVSRTAATSGPSHLAQRSTATEWEKRGQNLFAMKMYAHCFSRAGCHEYVFDICNGNVRILLLTCNPADRCLYHKSAPLPSTSGVFWLRSALHSHFLAHRHVDPLSLSPVQCRYEEAVKCFARSDNERMYMTAKASALVQVLYIIDHRVSPSITVQYRTTVQHRYPFHSAG
jgi:hypothetical protein